MKLRPITRLVTVIAALALLAGACGAQTETQDEAGQTASPAATAAGGEQVEVLRLAGGDFGYPTPFAWVRGPGLIQASMIYDTLVWIDGDGEFTPWLASDWEVSEDGTTWTFTLREEAAFHDGEQLTAGDVAFSFDYFTDGPGADTRAGGGLEVVGDVVAEDETTVVFQLPDPLARGAFLENVANRMFVVPEHIWSDIDDPAQARGEDVVVGSGPYTLAAIDVANGSYQYEANDEFYLGEPVVQRVEYVPAEDELLALERGELSAAEIAREPIPDAQLESLRSSFTEVDGTRDWNLALHFNLDEGFPYDDPGFRKGVAHAINREDMISRRLFGEGVAGSSGGLSPDHPMLADDLPDYAYDAERAGELLDETGLVDADGDGMRDLPDGSAFQPTILASNRFPAQGPQLVREYLREVGIDAQVEVLDRGAADEAAAEGNYTLALVGYGGLLNDPDFLRDRYASTSQSDSFSRAQGYANDRVDELAQEQLRTVDSDEREELIKELQQLIAEDLPILSLYVPQRRLFYDASQFEGWGYTPGCSACRASRSKLMFTTGGLAPVEN